MRGVKLTLTIIAFWIIVIGAALLIENATAPQCVSDNYGVYDCGAEPK